MKGLFYYRLDRVCLIGLAIRFVSQTVKHLCVTCFFFDTEVMEILPSILFSVFSYHLGVVLSFFLAVHCTMFNQSGNIDKHILVYTQYGKKTAYDKALENRDFDFFASFLLSQHFILNPMLFISEQ